MRQRKRWLAVLASLLALTGTLMTSATFAAQSYTVQPGDTLSKLADRFDVPLEDLIALNGITNPNRIHVGQLLQMPAPEAEPETADAETTAVDGEVEAEAEAEAETDTVSPTALSGRALLDERARILAERERSGDKIVAAASTYTGTRYRWGGLTSRGIDCSGLVVRAMSAQGIRVPRTSAALYKMGTKVTYQELQPGDLVFFNTNGRGVSHVGIWAGDNKFIHASSSRGVVTDTLTGYYSRKLVGARRLHKE